MNNLKMRTILTAATLFVGTAAAANAVAWYHMNDLPSGSRPTGYPAVVTNAAAPGTLTGKPYWQNGCMSFGGAVGSNSPYLPVYTNALPSGVSWYDPVSGTCGDDSLGIYFNTENGDGSGNGAAVLVTDDDALHCEHITVECFAKVALQNGKTGLKNWTHLLVMRNADQASTVNQTRNIKAWGFIVNSSGNLVVQMQIPNEGYADNGDGTYYDKTKSMPDLTTSGVNLADGKWHHVAMTFDGEYVRVYLDYNLNRQYAWTTPICYGTASRNRLCIGTADTATYGRWQGFIDEVRISDEALEPEKFVRAVEIAGAAASDDDTAVYVSCNSLSPMMDDNAKVFFNSACSTNAGKISLQFSTYGSGIWPRLDTGAAAVASSELHAGVAAPATIDNAGCWTYTNNLMGSAFVGKARQIWIDDYSKNDGEHLISSGDFTMECWFNKPATPPRQHRIFYEDSGPSGKNLSTIQVYLNASWLYCRLLSQEKFDKYQSGEITDLTGHWSDWYLDVADVVGNGWHHIALVVDKTNRKARFYLDKSLVLDREITDFVLASSVSGTSANYKYLKIGDGGDGNNSASFEDMSIDEIRITRRALDTSEFITRGPAGAEPVAPTRAWVGFEGNMKVYPRPDDLPTGSTYGAYSFLDRLGWTKVWRKGDTERVYLRNPNTGALSLPSSGVVSFGRNVLLERGMEAQTVELFVKVPPGGGEDQLVALYDKAVATAEDADSGVVWTVRKTAGGGVSVGVDPDGGGTLKTATFTGAKLNDGFWHHVAVTFEPQDADLRVAAYVDYAAAGAAQTLGDCGIRQGRTFATSCFVVGPYRGAVDEVRVSQGVLPLDEMMYTSLRNGLAISLR